MEIWLNKQTSKNVDLSQILCNHMDSVNIYRSTVSVVALQEQTSEFANVRKSIKLNAMRTKDVAPEIPTQ